ncbi:MAG: polyphosphate kinase 1 [Fimbriimonadaceae bacterium]|nr:polyphosphate kinase 1 [Fimbriimonadaceae bacterium]
MKRKRPPVSAERYLNRERSWLYFNQRVLEEAENERNPLLERLNFLSIFESNLDEFYMVRVSGLVEQMLEGVLEMTIDGLSPIEQARLIAATALPLRRRAGELWDRLRTELYGHGLRVRQWRELDEAHQSELRDFYEREVFPVCTPLILHPSPSPPFISNRSLNLAVQLVDKPSGPKLARVKVPSVLPRFIPVPRSRTEFVLLEDLIAHNLDKLFPGVEVRGAYAFRVLRDADIEIREVEAADLIATIERTIRQRRFGDAVLLQLAPAAPAEVRKALLQILELDEEDVFEIEGLLGLEALSELAKLKKPGLRYPTHHPYLCPKLAPGRPFFELLARRDVLVHHPYDSLATVEEFVKSAATDPDVIGIKQTLYRVGAESPIVDALLAAAEAGKQVAVMVELKARFDESNNLVWARALERAGVHVTYGFAEMKTHAKLCLVVRRESRGIKSYAHIGTGNYNPATARVYTDMGLFTSNRDITQDVSELFNLLTGFSRQRDFRKLVVAPLHLRDGIIDRIRREIVAFGRTNSGRIVFKMNSLVDPEVIDVLYEAAAAGIPIDLIVRGICCLRPGVKGLSDKVRVRSIVGRFLEHSRVYYFENGGEPEALIGSADLMSRNLDRRIETLVPITQRKIVEHLLDVLEIYLRDSAQTWVLQPDGEYRRLAPKRTLFDAQAHLMSHSSARILHG